MVESVLPGLQHLQNIHPLVVHFPVAFLAGAALLYVFAWLAGRESWAWTGLWLLALGTLSAAVAVGTGLYAEPGVMVARSVRVALLAPHKRLMLGTLGLSAAFMPVVMLVPLVHVAHLAAAAAARDQLQLDRVLVVVAGVSKGADYGARMVYDYNAGGDACGQPIDFRR